MVEIRTELSPAIFQSPASNEEGVLWWLACCWDTEHLLCHFDQFRRTPSLFPVAGYVINAVVCYNNNHSHQFHFASATCVKNHSITHFYATSLLSGSYSRLDSFIQIYLLTNGVKSLSTHKIICIKNFWRWRIRNQYKQTSELISSAILTLRKQIYNSHTAPIFRVDHHYHYHHHGIKAFYLLTSTS